MDMTKTIEPKSDQLDAVDLITGPRTFTITKLTAGSTEQPVNVHLKESPRPWRPSKSMRRVLVGVWGADGTVYTNRRVTLYCDPNVEFGGIKVGGIKISHMSHIDEPVVVNLLVKRGKTEMFRVQPLTGDTEGVEPSLEQIAACTDKDQLRAWWNMSGPQIQEAITARAQQLTVDTPPANVDTAKQALQQALEV